MHFTVTVEVKQTIEPKPITDDKGYQAKGTMGATLMSERRVLDRLRVVISADDEQDAVKRAITMLQTQVRTGPKVHLHRASCDDSGGNLVCGYPPGATIAGAS